MGFAEDIAKLSEQVRKRIDNVSGEEATKMALIVPFLSVLGYDVHNPSEVIPEYVADFAIKKAGQFEKVDYADEKKLENEEVDGVEEDKSKINTTEEEIAAFEKINLIVKASKNYKFEIQYKDTVSYFGVNLGKVTWWFLRLYLASTKKTFTARIGIDEAKSLAPDFVIQEIPATTGEAWSKVTITSIEDLDNLAPLILKCYELEAGKH